MDDTAKVVFAEDKATISVIGRTQEVDIVSKKIKSIVSTITEEYQVRKQTVTETKNVDGWQLDLLMQTDFMKTATKQKSMSITFELEKSQVTFKGLAKDIQSSKLNMFEILQNIHTESIPVKQATVEMLQNKTILDSIQKRMKQCKIVMVMEVKNKNLTVKGLNSSDVKKAKMEIKNMFFEDEILLDAQEQSLMESSQWNSFMTKLKSEHNHKICVFVERRRAVLVCCLAALKDKVIKQIKNFIETNVLMTEEIPMQPGVLCVVRTHMQKTLQNISSKNQTKRVSKKLIPAFD